MLFIIVFAVLLIVGIIVTHLYFNSYRGFWDHDVWASIGAAGVYIGLVGLVFSSVLCGRVLITKDIDYQEALYEKTVLEYRLETRDDNVVGNEMLYTEIVDFNKKLRFTKKWAPSPWMGWFVNEKLATIDYIRYKEVPNQWQN